MQELGTMLEIARMAVVKASEACERVRAEIPLAIEKADLSPVTVADFASQALICKALTDAFPEVAIVAEEDSDALRAPANAALRARVTAAVARSYPDATAKDVARWLDFGRAAPRARFWILDPVDGTKGFLRGGQYAVSLALVQDGAVVLGALGCPRMEGGPSVFSAARGEGAFEAPLARPAAMRRLRVNAMDDLAEAQFVESVEAAHSDAGRTEALRRRLDVRRPAVRVDSQAKYALVASGAADVYLRLATDPRRAELAWDHGAGAIVVEEAGGRVSDLAGEALDFGRGRELAAGGGIVVTNGAIHDRVLEALRREIPSAPRR